MVRYPVTITTPNTTDHPYHPTPKRPGSADQSTLTLFNSSSPHLNAVYDFGRYTILATSLDVNTDSNTRQRDNCEMDAFIAAMGQLRTSARYVPLVARSFEYSMRNGYHTDKHWTEFKYVSVMAVHQLLLHDRSVGLAIASKYYETIVSLTLIPHYYSQEEGLIVKGTPGWQQKNFPNSDCAACEPDLVDYPPKYLDDFLSPRNRSVVDNVYAVAVADAMVEIATAVGNVSDAKRSGWMHENTYSMSNIAYFMGKFYICNMQMLINTDMYTYPHDKSIRGCLI